MIKNIIYRIRIYSIYIENNFKKGECITLGFLCIPEESNLDLKINSVEILNEKNNDITLKIYIPIYCQCYNK